MPVTLKLDSHTINKMKSFYKSDLVQKTIPYVLFQAKIEHCTITAYTTGKVVFAGNNEAYEANIWSSTTIEKPKAMNASMTHIGSDEVGTGDFFGPMIVGACLVKEEDIPYLKSLGIMDSKKIKDETISELAIKIKERCLFATSILLNQQYNDYIDKGYNQGQLKALLHNDALSKLLNQINDRPFIIMDQFVNEKKYYDYLKDVDHITHIHFETKAEDKYLGVACGSIIARDLFLNAMDEISRKIKDTIPKGAGSHVDQFGIDLVDRLGVDILYHIAKVHFSNYARITKKG